MKNIIHITVLALSVFGPSTFAADDALSRLKAAAERNLQSIKEISAKAEPTPDDIRVLSEFIHESGNTIAEIPSDSLVKPAREALVNIASLHPSLFSEYVRQNRSDLQDNPIRVADLIITSVESAPGVLNDLIEQRLIKGVTVRLALARNTGYYSGAPLTQEIIEGNLAAQLPQKLKIACALFDAGIRGEELNDIFIEAVGSNRIWTKDRTGAIERLGTSATNQEDRAVDALKRAVLPPFFVLGSSVDDLHSMRMSALRAITKMTSQASVDALWEIAGMDNRSTFTERPVSGNGNVISLAKEERKKLLSTGDFKDRPVTDRLLRAFRCALSLIY